MCEQELVVVVVVVEEEGGGDSLTPKQTVCLFAVVTAGVLRSMGAEEVLRLTPAAAPTHQRTKLHIFRAQNPATALP